MRSNLMRALIVGALVFSVSFPARGRKKKKDPVSARLRALRTVYVDGTGDAVSYIRQNLSEQTCLKSVPLRSDADAVLDIWEMPAPCPAGTPGLCASVSVRLLDPATQKVLWFRTDDSLPQPDVVHGMRGPADWIMWNLSNSCCKGRPAGGDSPP